MSPTVIHTRMRRLECKGLFSPTLGCTDCGERQLFVEAGAEFPQFLDGCYTLEAHAPSRW
jgi:hypothetical protein